MPYPSAPWTLKGHSLQTLHLIDISKARPFVPSELDIISVLPGKTIAGVYIASYGDGSVLKYNELIVVPALVRHGKQFASWISHIYVDNPDSVAGGREIWGLPKELADFSWLSDNSKQVVVQQQTQLCTLSCSWQFNLWRQSITLPSFSALDANYLMFQGNAEANFALMGAKLDVPPESPFAALNLGQPWLAIKSEGLKLVAGVPSVIGQNNTAFSYK